MKNNDKESKPQKSTLLLVLFLFLLLNAAHLFRTSINTLYFTEDISGDYNTIKATVINFKPETAENKEKIRVIPVFSFFYKNEIMTKEAPEFAFDPKKPKGQLFQKGEEYTLWVHKRWGKFMIPPIMGPKELGASQLRISGFFLLLAIAIWVLRNRIAKKQA